MCTVPPPDKPRLNLQVAPELLAALDEWRRRQRDLPGRAEAARRLLEAALRAAGTFPPPREEG